MARLKSNILGGGSGKVGNIVMYERNGTACIRSIPLNYTDKKSEAQLRQRQKMNLTHQFLRPFKQLLQFSFFEADSGRSAYQSAQSYHLKNAISGEYPHQYLNNKKALLTRGNLNLPDQIQLEIEQNKAIITWDTDNPSTQVKWDDTLVIIWKNPLGTTDYLFSGVRRMMGRYELNFAPNESTDKTDIWVAFRNAKETDWSNSMYLSE